jgi:hypothetical protein
MSKKENVVPRSNPNGRNNITGGKRVSHFKQVTTVKHAVSGQHLSYSQLTAPVGSLVVRRERMAQVIPDVDMSMPLSSGSTIARATATQVLATPAPAGHEYVDPYLFETGHFESREEYEELSRTAKIKPRSRA